jgi:hypothetical protein
VTHHGRKMIELGGTGSKVGMGAAGRSRRLFGCIVWGPERTMTQRWLRRFGSIPLKKSSVAPDDTAKPHEQLRCDRHRHLPLDTIIVFIAPWNGSRRIGVKRQ